MLIIFAINFNKKPLKFFTINKYNKKVNESQGITRSHAHATTTFSDGNEIQKTLNDSTCSHRYLYSLYTLYLICTHSSYCRGLFFSKKPRILVEKKLLWTSLREKRNMFGIFYIQNSNLRKYKGILYYNIILE